MQQTKKQNINVINLRRITEVLSNATIEQCISGVFEKKFALLFFNN